MSTLEEATKPRDLSALRRIAPEQEPERDDRRDLTPPRSPYQRTTIPPFSVSPDNLRAMYQGGIPQTRLFNPPSAIPGSSSGGTSVTNIVSTGGSTTVTTNNAPLAQTASTTTGLLAPGARFQGSLPLAKSFQLYSLAVSAPARVRLYSTASAQAGDVSRDTLTSPGLGNEQGIVGDFVLDTLPLSWHPAPACIGSNGDSPQTTLIYLTVDNIGAGSTSITLSFTYIPSQS